MPVVVPADPRPQVDELARLSERFDRFSYGLVRLETHPLEELQRRIAEFGNAVERHLDAAATKGSEARGASAARLSAEHQRFRVSVGELRGLLAVVEREDHGGHRQALGQYGRIFAEALRVHLRDEIAPAGRGAEPRSGPGAQS